MDQQTDARNLARSQILTATLEAFRVLLVERWQGATDSLETREQCFAGIRAVNELTEFLHDRIASELGDESTDGAE